MKHSALSLCFLSMLLTPFAFTQTGTFTPRSRGNCAGTAPGASDMCWIDLQQNGMNVGVLWFQPPYQVIRYDASSHQTGLAQVVTAQVEAGNVLHFDSSNTLVGSGDMNYVIVPAHKVYVCGTLCQ